jgi:putative ABC transport system permease protein
MSILAKKTLRDLWKAKLRTIAIVAVIALSVGIGIGMVNAAQDAYHSFDKRYQVTNYEDIKISFGMTNLNLSQIQSINGVDTVVGRIFTQTQCAVGDKKFETQWIAAPYYDKAPYAQINGYQFFEGQYFSSADASEALVGNLFAKANKVSVGDTVEVDLSNSTLPLKVAGIVGSPEYLYVISDAGWPEPSLLLPLFTSYDTAVNAMNLTQGDYNQLLVTVKSGYEASSVKQNVESVLLGEGVRITQSVLGIQEADYQFSRSDAGSLNTLGWAFGVLVIITSAVIIYNTITRLIASQRAYIGVMEALGGYKRDMIVHYCLFGFLMGVVGAIVGVGLGAGINYVVVTEYSGIIGLASPVTSVFWQYLILFGSLGIGISTLAAFLGSIKTLSIGPRMAMTSQYLTQSFSKKPLLEQLFEKFLGQRKILSRVPLRNLFRHRGRTTVTIIAIAVSMIVVFASLGMTINFLQPLQRNYSNYEKWGVQVTLAGYQNETQIISKLSAPSIAGLNGEAMIDDYVGIEKNSEVQFVHIQAFEENSSLRSFNVISGSEDLKNGVLVGSILAKKQNIKVGDTLTFVVANRMNQAKVVGIAGELLDNSVFMTLGTATNLLYTGGTVNALIMDTGSRSQSQIESVVRSNFSVASFVFTTDVLNGIASLLNGIVALMSIFIIFGVAAEVLFISSTMALNVIERDSEFISLRAMGADPRRILRMVTNEIGILLVPSIIIGLILGVFATQWMIAAIVQNLMYYNIVVGPTTYIITAIIAIIAAYLAAYISARHITKLKLVDTIRQRMLT